jgi:hypothetical protein
MKTLIVLLAAGFVTPAYSACYLPLGEIDGYQTSETTFAGEANIYLRKPPTLVGLTGQITGTVKAINGEGLPSRIAYTFTTDKGTIGLTGTPNWAVYADQGYTGCSYSIDIPIKVSWGKLNGKPVSGSMLVRGVNNVCTYEESYTVVSGGICY